MLRNMKYFYLTILVLVLTLSCEDEPENRIKINADLPESFVLGDIDTLKFTIVSEAYLSTVGLWEESRSYVLLDWRVLGKYTREYDLNLLYDPKSTGKKSMELRASDGVTIVEYPFTINVISE
jgi:hypothetical protein